MASQIDLITTYILAGLSVALFIVQQSLNLQLADFLTLSSFGPLAIGFLIVPLIGNTPFLKPSLLHAEQFLNHLRGFRNWHRVALAYAMGWAILAVMLLTKEIAPHLPLADPSVTRALSLSWSNKHVLLYVSSLTIYCVFWFFIRKKYFKQPSIDDRGFPPVT